MSSWEEEENMLNSYVGAMLDTTKILGELEDESDSEASSVPLTRSAALNRDREGAHERLVADYFDKECVYTAEQFKRRFRMSRRLFERIADDLANYDEFLTIRWDARGKRGFTTLQKCTSVIRQLAYDTASDAWDEYLKMSNRMSRECLYQFCEDVVKLYSKVYMRTPRKSNIEKIYAHHAEKHGFQGMLGSLDCTHWPWHNFPTAWKGSCNDLNVLARSQIFDPMIRGTGPDDSFWLNGIKYKHGYFLCDGIYPSYSSIVKTILNSTYEKRKKFAKCQEAARKDIERLYGVIKAKWHIIECPARAFHPQRLRYIMYACLILHNIIIEDEGRAICVYDLNEVEEGLEPVDEGQEESNTWALHDTTIHGNLVSDLIDHIWNNFHVNHGHVEPVVDDE